MPSAIDPTKPQDDTPAVKLDLRANLTAAKTELEHGGFAEGLTPGNYGPPANSQVKTHLASIDAKLGTLGGAGGLAGWVDVKTSPYNAAGDSDGTRANGTDDTAAIQAAIDSGAAVIYFPPGIYRVTGSLNCVPGQTLIGAGPTKSIINGMEVTGATTGVDGVVSCLGTPSALPALSSAISRGDGTIAFSSSVQASLNHGDWIRLRDTTSDSLGYAGMSRSKNDGFYARVMQGEGTTAYLAHDAERKLPSDRTSGALSNVTAEKMDGRGLALRHLGVRGAGWDHLAATSPVNAYVVSLRDLANVDVEDCHIEGGGAVGFFVDLCCNVRIVRSTVTSHAGARDESTGYYGLYLNGTGFAYLDQNHLLAHRHALDVEGDEVPSHDVFATNCVIGTGTHSAFEEPAVPSYYALDFHAGVFNAFFSNCAVYGGAVLRGGHRYLFSNCYFVGALAGNGGVISIDFEVSQINIAIRDCDIVQGDDHWKNKGGVIRVEPHQLFAGEENLLVIERNRIWADVVDTDSLIAVTENDAKSPSLGQIVIRDNVVERSTSTRDLLLMEITDFQSLYVAGNVLPSNVSLGTTDANSSSFDRWHVTDPAWST